MTEELSVPAEEPQWAAFLAIDWCAAGRAWLQLRGRSAVRSGCAPEARASCTYRTFGSPC